MQSDSASTMENLSRLASKPGVQSTLVLSATDGAIIRSSGFQQEPQSSGPANPENNRHASGQNARSDGSIDQGRGTDAMSINEIANLVFSFVTSAGFLARGLEQGDEIQLLRLRTRKNEIVIVPDSKYLLIVIHDAPSAT